MQIDGYPTLEHYHRAFQPPEPDPADEIKSAILLLAAALLPQIATPGDSS